METLDLTKILAGCPKGTPLYSPLFGRVTLSHIANGTAYPITVEDRKSCRASFSATGLYYDDEPDAECILFPSKDCRDWSQFKQPQQEFKNGDHVLWHNNDGNEFFGVFSRYTEDGQGVIRLLRGEIVSDWDIYIKDLTKVEKFDPKWFKTGDAVLVRNFKDEEWEYAIFSHIVMKGYFGKFKYFKASCSTRNMCIPYNVETKHLIGTTEDAPEFYNFK